MDVWADPGRAVHARLDDPPEIASFGVGVHGTIGTQDVFHLPDLWQLHLYEYTAELIVDGVPHAIRPGRVSLVPPACRVEYRYQGRSEHLYAHLRLPASGEPRTVPVIQNAGAQTPLLSSLLRQGMTPGPPSRARAAVWAALWCVAGLSSPAERPHAAVAAALAHIESHLAEPLTVPEVARTAGVSHNHLTRLFRAETGDTVVAHIRRRRMERARHLLRESTLSIPAVAASVGIGDLHAFNKTCRRELGASPRKIRGAL